LILSPKTTAVYMESSKYMLYLIKVDPRWLGLRPSAFFGTTELFENIERTVHWVDHTRLRLMCETKQIHVRLMRSNTMMNIFCDSKPFSSDRHNRRRNGGNNKRQEL